MSRTANEWKPHGTWGGAVDERRCRAAVYSDQRSSQCSNKASVDGKWCGTHSPAAIAKRDAAREARDAADKSDRAKRDEARARAALCVNALASVPHPEHLPALLEALFNVKTIGSPALGVTRATSLEFDAVFEAYRRVMGAE